MTDLDKLASIAHTAVDLACDILTSTRPSHVQEKSDRDFVTDVDLAIEREVRAHLSRITPEFGFLGEENGHADQAGAPGNIWVLDPIDGTTNYAHGLPFYAVALALISPTGTLVGVIDAPALGLRYHAITGHGAYRNGTPIRTSTTTQLARSVVAIGDYATGPHAAEKNTRRLRLTAELAARIERIRMIGTAALDLAFVADGSLDACAMMSNKPWDTAAGVLVAREAGAHVTDADGTPHTLRSIETIATTPGITTDLLDIAKTIRSAI